jgi:DNA-binding GntR family transcriptional regulator
MALELRIDRQSTAERIAEALRTAILRGDVEPGEPLREAAICESAGVSRNTVREALRLLANEGLVKHNAFRGVSVTKLDEADVADIFGARLALELTGIAATANASREQLAAFEHAATGFERAVEAEDWPTAFNHDIELHAASVATVGSRRLDEWFRALMRELRLAYLMFGGLETESLPIDRQEHWRIVELIGAGDRDGCAELIGAHLTRSEQLLLGLMRSRREAPRPKERA